jgi:hypothetical protein
MRRPERLAFMLTAFLLTSATSLVAADNTLTSKEKADGWILLFDGKTLNGWDATLPPPVPGATPAAPATYPQVGNNPRPCSTPIGKAPVPPGTSHWEVVKGAISPCDAPPGNLATKASYKNFVLAVDFRTGEETNSGVFVRSPGNSGGYEVQIWKAQPAGFNTGSIVGVGKTEGEFKFIPGQWNHYEITAQGDHFTIVLNGMKTLDVHDSKSPEGSVRLQYQKFPIEFKNIKLKVLKN